MRRSSRQRGTHITHNWLFFFNCHAAITASFKGPVFSVKGSTKVSDHLDKLHVFPFVLLCAVYLYLHIVTSYYFCDLLRDYGCELAYLLKIWHGLTSCIFILILFNNMLYPHQINKYTNKSCVTFSHQSLSTTLFFYFSKCFHQCSHK